MLTKPQARKEIKSQEGFAMANNQFQLDQSAADLNQNKRLSNSEQQSGEAVQRMQQDQILEIGHEFMNDLTD